MNASPTQITKSAVKFGNFDDPAFAHDDAYATIYVNGRDRGSLIRHTEFCRLLQSYKVHSYSVEVWNAGNVTVAEEWTHRNGRKVQSPAQAKAALKAFVASCFAGGTQ